MKIFIQSKLENNEVKIAQQIEYNENTSNREAITLIQELRHITKYLEEYLYKEWRKNHENN